MVSSKSPITTLSKNQVADIFFGRASRFPDGTQAVPIDQAEGSVVRERFYTKLAGKSDAQKNAYWSKIIFTGRGQPPKDVPNSVAMKKMIVENLATIGCMESDMVDGSVRVLLTQ